MGSRSLSSDVIPILGLMWLPIQMLSQITDGQAAWDSFIAGVERTFEANAASAPALALVVVVAIVLWLDYRLARWIVRIPRKSGKGEAKRARRV